MLPTMYSTRNQGWLPTIFNDFFNDEFIMPTAKFRGSSPAINVTEDDKEYRVEVAAPGMTKNDFCIKLTNEGDIVISMEKKNSNESDNTSTASAQANNNKKYLRREFSYSKFEQTLTLPENVEKDKITASMTDGVLSIGIQKMTEERKAEETKFIEIK